MTANGSGGPAGASADEARRAVRETGRLADAAWGAVQTAVGAYLAAGMGLLGLVGDPDGWYYMPLWIGLVLGIVPVYGIVSHTARGGRTGRGEPSVQPKQPQTWGGLVARMAPLAAMVALVVPWLVLDAWGVLELDEAAERLVIVMGIGGVYGVAAIVRGACVGVWEDVAMGSAVIGLAVVCGVWLQGWPLALVLGLWFACMAAAGVSKHVRWRRWVASRAVEAVAAEEARGGEERA